MVTLFIKNKTANDNPGKFGFWLAGMSGFEQIILKDFSVRISIIRLFLLLALLFPTLAAASFANNGDGTVIDTTTGLTWMRCSMGQTWDGTTCTGTAGTYTWDQATALSSTFAGQSDWRLPNVRELQTIADKSLSIPVIDAAAFPNTPASYFWSGSSYVALPSNAWGVYFFVGLSLAYLKSFYYFVRLVRGGQSSALLSEARPNADYTDNGDGTVTHKPTGLIWKQCSEGQSGAACTGTPSQYIWAQAVALTSTFAGKSDWRLPTNNELASLADFTVINPSINTTLFPGTTASGFWSGSSYVADPSYAWYVNFNVGYSFGLNKAGYNYVRLVRGGQSLGSLSAPGAPTSVSATATNAQASVSFTAPSNNGGALITSYTVTSNPGNISATGTVSPITVKGLVNGTSYTFSVIATNATGMTSAASTASSPVIPPTLPGAPTNVSALSRNVSAAVSFTAPVDDGGASITGYTVTSNPAGGVDSNSGTTALTHIVTGLSNGVSYTFSVTATNSVGTGASATSNSVIPAVTIPDAPTNVTATAGNTQATVSYAAPVNNGGSAIIFYTVTASPGGKTVTSSSNPIIVTGLSNSTPYSFVVTATNGLGTSLASLSSSPVTPTRLSQSIGAISITPATLAVGVTTTASATATSGLAVSFTSLTTNTCTVNASTVTGVATGICTIAANQAGNTDYNPVTPQVKQDFTVVASPPGVPTNVSATVENGQSTISFSPPASNGGATITYYTVTSNPGGLTSFGFASPLVVTGLTNGSSYTFTVTAANSAGIGAASAASNAVIPSKPGQTISFGAPPSILSGGSGTIIATGGASVNPVIFTSITPATCTVSGTNGSKVSGNATGICTIAANQAADANNNAATQATLSLNIVYTDNHDGTVTDARTGLTWMRCSMGQTWDGTTCTGTAGTYTWAQATALTSTFAGQSDWRLPKLRELLTIADISLNNPAIDATAFPNTPVMGFWSGSSWAANPTIAWIINISGGSGLFNKTSVYNVRLVRGGQSSALLSETRPNSDYIDNGDGTVTHKPTGLIWKQCSEGQTGATCAGTPIAYVWAQAVALAVPFAGKNDWRLPTEVELSTLPDYTLQTPSINVTLFPNTFSSYFWSGSSIVQNLTDALLVDFSNGSCGPNTRTNASYVRLVRGGHIFGTSVPGSPTNVSATAGNASAIVNFTAPVSDGGTAITGYTVTSSPGGFTSTGAAAPITVTGLSNGTPYTFTVTAANFDGVGIASTASTPVVPSIISQTTIISNTNPSAFGQSVTFTATVTGSGGTPSGTVTFKDGTTTLGTGTLSSGTATYTTSGLALNSHSITAVYGGDTNFATSTSAVLTQTVNQNNSATAISSGTNPSTFGQSVTFTATVTSSGGTPTGTVTFKDGVTTLGTVTLTGGVATYATSAQVLNGHNITAVYGGDTNFATSTSSALTQTVNQASASTALTSGTNPSTYGQSVTFTATVTSSGGTPTGTVTFKDGATTLGIGALISGTANYSTTALVLNGHSITAVYGGDSNFSTSTSSVLTQTVNQSSSTTAISSNANPSAFGQSVTFTATVTSTGGIPTGTVTFKDGATTLGTGTLISGIANYSTTALALSSHSITAVYGGDGNFSTSTSSVLTQAVNQSSSATAISSGTNPSTFGQSVTFTATVTSSGGTPTGTITFKDGTTTLGTGTLTGGVATYATSALLLNNHNITAVYAGDANFSVSTSSALTQMVNVTIPSAPSILHMTAGNGVAYLSVAVSASDGGSPVTGYVAQCTGNVTATSLTSPIKVTLVNGSTYSCQVAAQNSVGQSSFSSAFDKITPSPTPATAQIIAGAAHTFAIRNDGALLTWGSNANGQLGETTSSSSDRSIPQVIGSDFIQVATSINHGLGIKFDGTLWAWGDNTYGQLGDGTKNSHGTPVQIGTVADYVAVAVGNYHSLALKADGTLWAWGDNSSGQLGIGSTISSDKPKLVDTGFQTIAAGGSHSMALKSDNTLWAWGDNTFGQLGDGTTKQRTVPSPIGTNTYHTITAGYDFSMALKANVLYVWGNNQYGQLGLGDNTILQKSDPTPVANSVFTAIAAGFRHAVAIDTQSTVWTWGDNTYGQLGDNTTKAQFAPKSLNLNGFARVSAGYSHTAGVKKEGTGWLTGKNLNGQLGDGTYANRLGAVIAVNETFDKYLDLAPSNSKSVSQDQLPSLYVDVANVGKNVSTTFNYFVDDLNQNGNVYVVALLDCNSKLFAQSQCTTAPVQGNPQQVTAVLTRTGWKQAASGATESRYSGVLNSSNNNFTLYDTSNFNPATDNGIICVAYAGASTSSAKGLIRSVVTGINASLACPQIQIASTPNIQVPGMPLNVVASAGDGLVSVSFGTPASDGGSPITGYTVTASPGGNTGKALSPPIVISALTNGTAYSFTVTATNSAGDSAAAATLNSVTPMGSQLINFSAPLSKTYGDAPIILSANGGASGNPVTFSVVSGSGSLSGTNNSTLSITGAGSIVVKASQAGNSLYSAATEVQQTIVVSPKALTITASNASRVYGAVNPTAPGFTTSALAGNDAISSLNYLYADGATSSAAVGTTYAITPTAAIFSSGNAANYTINYVPGTLLITGIQSIGTISFNPSVLLLNGTVLASASGGASGIPVIFSSNTTDICSVSGVNGSTITGRMAGTCIIAANQAGNGNYAAATERTQSIYVGSTATLNLVAKWNLLGNSMNAMLTVADIFNDTSKVNTVWKWMPATRRWAFYTPSMNDGGAAYAASKSYDFLTTINGGEGYWVNANSAFSVSIPGGSAVNAIYFQDKPVIAQNKLLQGWNLIAIGDNLMPSDFNKQMSTTLPTQQGVIPENITTLWAWDSVLSSWYFYAPSMESSGVLGSYITSKGYLDFSLKGKTLDPTTGFWVNKP